jgi:hypothetical protein
VASIPSRASVPAPFSFLLPAWFSYHHLDHLSSPSLTTTGQEILFFFTLFFRGSLETVPDFDFSSGLLKQCILATWLFPNRFLLLTLVRLVWFLLARICFSTGSNCWLDTRFGPALGSGSEFLFRARSQRRRLVFFQLSSRFYCQVNILIVCGSLQEDTDITL